MGGVWNYCSSELGAFWGLGGEQKKYLQTPNTLEGLHVITNALKEDIKVQIKMWSAL